MKANLIVPCGGSGVRSGLSNKLLTPPRPTSSVPTIVATLHNFLAIDEIAKVILPCPTGELAQFKEAVSKYYRDDVLSGRIVFCCGGDTRSNSVKNALALVDTQSEITIIHDGARPFTSHAVIIGCISTAMQHGSAITAISPTDTVAITLPDGSISSVPSRDNLRLVQTPQAFTTNSIIRAYKMVGATEVYTDDSSVYQAKIGSTMTCLGELSNKKLTFREDYDCYDNIKVGIGHDTHQLVVGRDLILGGIAIPHDKGLLGHSDADALIHAIMDAILTACNERDIGVLFPDSDIQYKGISSILLLERVFNLISKDGYKIVNIDAVIMAERPKLMKYIPLMIDKLSQTLNMNTSQIGISATTTEGLGFIGREEGISVNAVVSVTNTNGGI